MAEYNIEAAYESAKIDIWIYPIGVLKSGAIPPCIRVSYLGNLYNQ